MKTKTLLSTLFASFLLVTNLSAQQPTFEWARQMGGAGYARPSSISTDMSGNLYSIGYFQDTIDFDPGTYTNNLISSGEQDIFIQKISASGNLVWVKQMGGELPDFGFGIATDTKGDFYTTGVFSGTVDFDPGEETINLTTKMGRGSFIQKFFTNGNLNWVKQIGGQKDYVNSVAIATDVHGNVYTAGSFAGTVGFETGAGTFYLKPSKGFNYFIQKLDSTGAFLWVKQIGGVISTLTTDINGNLFTTGCFDETIDFDPGDNTTNLTPNGYHDIFIQKLDAEGNFLWAKQMGGTGTECANSITTDANGNVYITGYFTDTVDFDPGEGTTYLTSIGGRDAFIQKLDAKGNFQWAKQMGGKFRVDGISITADVAGNIYTTGTFSETANFNMDGVPINFVSNGKDDIFIQKLDTVGNVMWAKQIGGADMDDVQSITVDGNGNIYVTGTFGKTIDFGGGIEITNLSPLNYGLFILKLNHSATVGITENTFTENIQVYPNPTTGDFAIKFETIQKELSLRIMSISGQILETRTFQNTDFVQLKLNQPNGIYLVDVLNEKGDRTGFRLIKK